MQSEVAELVGISRGVYGKMESGELDRFEKSVVDKLAVLYGVPVPDLLDEYNLFLYKGQGRQLREYREKLGIGKRTLARQMGVDHNYIRNWESEKKILSCASWEKYWRERLI